MKTFCTTPPANAVTTSIIEKQIFIIELASRYNINPPPLLKTSDTFAQFIK